MSNIVHIIQEIKRNTGISGSEKRELLRKIYADPKNARKIMEGITDNKIPLGHVGPKSKEVLAQELFSLENTKPAFRKSDWDQNRHDILEEVAQLDQTDQDWVMDYVESRLRAEN